MTEQKWLACTDPHRMLDFLREGVRWHHRLLELLGINSSPVGERKLRLFACACCRLLWTIFSSEGNRTHVTDAVETSERYADGLISREELRHAEQQTLRALSGSFLAAGAWVASKSAWEAAQWECDVGGRLVASRTVQIAVDATLDSDTIRARFFCLVEQEKLPRAELLRDIFGNPFHAVAVKSAWQTATVLNLAQAIYDSRGFDRLPILGDALEDAGCDNADILNHCRQPGEHVRGCWVVDLILGKS